MLSCLPAAPAEPSVNRQFRLVRKPTVSLGPSFLLGAHAHDDNDRLGRFGGCREVIPRPFEMTYTPSVNLANSLLCQSGAYLRGSSIDLNQFFPVPPGFWFLVISPLDWASVFSFLSLHISNSFLFTFVLYFFPYMIYYCRWKMAGLNCFYLYLFIKKLPLSFLYIFRIFEKYIC